MKNTFEKILEQLNDFTLPAWEKMPDLDLYMDQVITYLDRELNALAINENDKMITASMINNYVKGGLLPPPNQKKYNKEHLIKMIVICSIKQILSISDTSTLLNNHNYHDIQSLYQRFVNSQKESMEKVCSEAQTLLANLSETNDAAMIDALNVYVIKLAIDAEVRKILAEKIMTLIKSQDVDSNIHPKEEKEKKESKKKSE